MTFTSNSDFEAKLSTIDLLLEELWSKQGWPERTYHTGLVLLAAARVGPKVNRIAGMLQLEESFVSEIAIWMRGSQLWDETSASADDWFDEPAFVGFFEHLGVAMGFTVCVQTDEGPTFVTAREISCSVM